MKLRFDFDESALLGSAVQRAGISRQWVPIPTEVRSMQALEAHLRQLPWGGWIAREKLAFMIGEGEVQGSTTGLVG